jgi:hypothetical protein
MSQRGRGCLEIRPSDSAFYRTTTSEIGDRPIRNQQDRFKEIEFNDTTVPETETSSTSQSLAFLYKRESDKIGSRVQKGGMDTLQMTLSATRRARQMTRTQNMDFPTGSVTGTGSTKINASEILAAYNQGTKVEDPRFTTTSNEYGKKAPTIATFVSERSIRPQGFSKSFQNVTPKNTSLNTSMTKSNVHPNLDPQFA